MNMNRKCGLKLEKKTYPMTSVRCRVCRLHLWYLQEVNISLVYFDKNVNDDSKRRVVHYLKMLKTKIHEWENFRL